MELERVEEWRKEWESSIEKEERVVNRKYEIEMAQESWIEVEEEEGEVDEGEEEEPRGKEKQEKEQNIIIIIMFHVYIEVCRESRKDKH